MPLVQGLSNNLVIFDAITLDAAGGIIVSALGDDPLNQFNVATNEFKAKEAGYYFFNFFMCFQAAGLGAASSEAIVFLLNGVGKASKTININSVTTQAQTTGMLALGKIIKMNGTTDIVKITGSGTNIAGIGSIDYNINKIR